MPHASRPTPATASGSAVPTPVTGSGPVPVTGEAEKDLNENRPVTAVTAVTADLAIESNPCLGAGVGAQAGVGARTLLNEFGGNTGNIGNRNEYSTDFCQFSGVVSVTAFIAKAGTEPRKVVTAELVAWHRGVAALQYLPPPPGFDPRRWKTLQLDAAGLLEGYGEELLHLGWSDVDAFGVHPTHPAIRPDCMGLGPLLNGGWVVEVTADIARIERRSGAKLTGVRRPLERAVPVWELRLEGEWLRAGRKPADASPKGRRPPGEWPPAAPGLSAGALDDD